MAFHNLDSVIVILQHRKSECVSVCVCVCVKVETFGLSVGPSVSRLFAYLMSNVEEEFQGIVALVMHFMYFVELC